MLKRSPILTSKIYFLMPLYTGQTVQKHYAMITVFEKKMY
jgi:hypothetical protein